MTPRFRVFIVALSGLFWGGLVLTGVLGRAGTLPSLRELAPLLGFAIAAEALHVGQQDKGGGLLSFSAAAHVAIAIVFGPVPAALAAAGALIVVDGLRLAQMRHLLGNSAMFGLSIWVAGEVYVGMGGSVGSVHTSDLVPLTALILVRFVMNSVIYAGGVSASGGGFALTLRDELRDGFTAAVGEGSLGVLVAYAYCDKAWVVLPFLIPLLVALYTSRSNFERLRKETADVLNAFARVIDERDSSTAEHSERVAQSVRDFVEAIDLSDRESDRLVDAARFHDLGKIAVDVATLSKSSRLTDEELRAIRRHPRLSARVLAPFHFAKEMAVYAELHHERYDGRGYYSVPQREIPIEAHVLIVADSYDAMINKRAYRDALTPAEAVQELRDKAGSQFHPLVAAAFAAMIEGKDVAAEIGPSQLAALLAEFSRIPMTSLPSLEILLRPSVLTVGLAAAALGVAGIDAAPIQVSGGLLALAVVSGVAWSAGAMSLHRRRGAAQTVLEQGGDASSALAEARLPGWVAWLDWDAEGGVYVARPEAEQRLAGDDLHQTCSRALRHDGWLCSQLPSGLWMILAGGRVGDLRLAAFTESKPSRSDIELVRTIGSLATVYPGQRATRLVVLEGSDQRRPADGQSAAIALVELRAFDDVRMVAGQLLAERAVAEAESRLRMQLRDGDEVVRIGDDGFGVLLTVTGSEALEGVVTRIRDAISEVPVPRRARQLRPYVRALPADQAGDDPELQPVLERLSAPAGKRAAG